MSIFIVVNQDDPDIIERVNLNHIISYHPLESSKFHARILTAAMSIEVHETVRQLDALIEEARKKESERKREEEQEEYETVLARAKKLYEEIYRVEPPVPPDGPSGMGAWPIQPIPPNGPSDTEPPQEVK